MRGHDVLMEVLYLPFITAVLLQSGCTVMQSFPSSYYARAVLPSRHTGQLSSNLLSGQYLELGGVDDGAHTPVLAPHFRNSIMGHGLQSTGKIAWLSSGNRCKTGNRFGLRFLDNSKQGTIFVTQDLGKRFHRGKPNLGSPGLDLYAPFAIASMHSRIFF